MRANEDAIKYIERFMKARDAARAREVRELPRAVAVARLAHSLELDARDVVTLRQRRRVQTAMYEQVANIELLRDVGDVVTALAQAHAAEATLALLDTAPPAPEHEPTANAARAGADAAALLAT